MRPYNDDYMTFNELYGQWVLTEKALLDSGIDLRARLAGRKAISPDSLINGLLLTVSEQIYGFIHAHSVHNEWQDCVLASDPVAKRLLFRALMQQAIHTLNVGNLTYSVKAEERAAAINDVAKQILGQRIPCIGTSILYGGTSDV